MDLEAINLKLNRGYDGEGPATIFYDLRALLEEVKRLRLLMDTPKHLLAAEVERYKAALKKMVIPGTGKACTCGACYVCIALDALGRTTTEASAAHEHAWKWTPLGNGDPVEVRRCECGALNGSRKRDTTEGGSHGNA